MLWLCGALLLMGFAPRAEAHADLERSDPPAGASLARSPALVVLTFSEGVDAASSLIAVVDANGTRVGGASAAEGVPGDPAGLQSRLTVPLQPGTYSVNWRTVSSDDGHVTSGAYAFGVGETPAPGSAVTIVLLHTSPWISVGAAAGRWALYLGLALLLGAAATCGLVLGARLPAHGVALLWGALGAAFLGLCLSVAAERVAVGAPRLLPLFVTREGFLLVLEGAALLLCVGAVVLVDWVPGRWALATLGVTAMLAMFVHVYAGHAYSPAALRVPHIVTQWVHLAAVGVWIGGLVWLLLGMRERDHDARAAAVRGFSRVATVALVVVLSAGALRAVAEVGSWAALTGTGYGRMLLAKLALVAVLVVLGAVQHFRSVPRAGAAGAADADPTRPLRRTARGELAVAAVVLAATAVLAGLAPPHL